jgi:hypothetical protein
MALEAGAVEPVGDEGSGNYNVGVSDYDVHHMLKATGVVFVTLTPSDYPDENSMHVAARGLALQMVHENPSLLTPVRLTGGDEQHHTPQYDATGKTPFSDGKSKHGDGWDGQVKRVLSPDESGAAL